MVEIRDQATHASKHVNTGRVLPFRPRTSDTVAHANLESAIPNNTPETGPDDFRHRMLVNAAGLTFAVVLTAAGIWLAFSLSDLRRNQDCALTGRRDCAPIVALDRHSLPLRQH